MLSELIGDTQFCTMHIKTLEFEVPSDSALIFSTKNGRGSMLKRFVALSFGAIFFLSSQALAVDLNFENTFQIRMTIDHVYTEDNKIYKIAASGSAGRYGQAYSSWKFSDNLGLKDRGEFSGFAWTQIGAEVFKASLQGVYVKQGPTFRIYSLDLVSDKKLQMKVGEINMVEKTMNFDVSDIKLEP